MPSSTAHTETLDRKKIRLLSSLSFGLGFFDAFLLYVLSSYFLQIVDESRISWFYLVAFGLVLWFLTRLQPWVQHFGSVRILLVLLVGLISLSFFLATQTPSWIGAVVLVGFMACNTLVWSVMDILVEDFSTDQFSGRVRGLYLTILNLGLLLAPLLSTRTLDQFGHAGIFFGLGVGYSFLFLLTLITLRQHDTVKREPIAFWNTLRRAFKNNNIAIIYFLSWILEFFYVIMIIYAPLLLLGRGLDWQTIGVIFTVMLLPFVLIQYPLGILADKAWGEKEMLIAALTLMALATWFFGVTSTNSVLLLGVILFATRVGAAALEILRDSYFYKQIDAADTDLVAFFRTARPMANIIGACFALGMLHWLPIHTLFVAVAALTAFSIIAAYFLPDTQPA